MAPQKIPIVFDVLGTCFSFDAAVDALALAFKDQLKAVGVSPISVVDDWFHSAQRDFTYLSMNDSYIPIGQVLKGTLPRTLLMSGLTPPSPTSSFSASLLAPILATLSAMSPRPSLKPMSALLQSTGKFRLLAATNGGRDSTLGLFVRALGDENGWAVWSCDEIQVAKPAPKVYSAIWETLGIDEKDEGRHAWFVAAHEWDLQAARKAGFKTAWVSYEERVSNEDLFGKFDVVAVDLVDAAKQIIALEA